MVSQCDQKYSLYDFFAFNLSQPSVTYRNARVTNALSKTLKYDFHYNYIKKKYGEGASLLFTDTDSLAYEIDTEDFYKNINPQKFVERLFDTSNYPANHESGIKVGTNKKVPGMFKDEAGGKEILEFVGLRAKLYSYRMK